MSADDWIDGQFVPKGTIVLINAWGLHQDEKYFPDPDKFEPARYAGRTLLAPDYAASPDYGSRDHYIYGELCNWLSSLLLAPFWWFD